MSIRIAMAYGRFNPPHKGHVGLWNKTHSVGGRNWYIGTNPVTNGINDPLPFAVKKAWMEAIDANLKGHIKGETSILTLASKIFEKYSKEGHVYLSYVTDDKDWKWSGPLLKKYNGVEGPHGYYKFVDIEWVHNPRIMSATDLRKDVMDGNEASFYANAGVDPNIKINNKSFFETVQQYLLPFKQAEEEKAAERVEKERIKQEKETIKAEKERIKQEKAAAKIKGPAKQMAEAANAAQQAAIAINMKKHNKKPKKLSEHLDSMFTERFSVLLDKEHKKIIAETDFHADLKRLGKDGDKMIAAMKGGMSLPGISQTKSNGNPYQGYRFGLALATSDGKGTLHTPPAGAMAGDPLLTVYTTEEYEMIKQAAKDVVAGPIRKLSDMASREANDTHKTSPIAKRKPNKYGV